MKIAGEFAVGRINRRLPGIVLMLAATVLLWGCAGSAPTVPAEPPARAEVGTDVKKEQQQKIRKARKAESVKKTGPARKRKKPRKQAPIKQAHAAPPAAPEVDETVKAAEPAGVSAGGPEAEPVVGRMQFHYDYYPDAGVYFDTIRHLYFYREKGDWVMSVALPAAFQGGIGDSVRLKMESDRPYVDHEEHRREYPPGQNGSKF